MTRRACEWGVLLLAVVVAGAMAANCGDALASCVERQEHGR